MVTRVQCRCARAHMAFPLYLALMMEAWGPERLWSLGKMLGIRVPILDAGCQATSSAFPGREALGFPEEKPRIQRREVTGWKTRDWPGVCSVNPKPVFWWPSRAGRFFPPLTAAPRCGHAVPSAQLAVIPASQSAFLGLSCPICKVGSQHLFGQDTGRGQWAPGQETLGTRSLLGPSQQSTVIGDRDSRCHSQTRKASSLNSLPTPPTWRISR